MRKVVHYDRRWHVSLPISHTSAKIWESTTLHFLAVLALFTYIICVVEPKYHGCSMCLCVHEIQVFLFMFISNRRRLNIHDYVKLLWILDLFWLLEFCLEINLNMSHFTKFLPEWTKTESNISDLQEIYESNYVSYLLKTQKNTF